MDYYQELARLIADECPPGFSEAVLDAELDEGWAQIKVICKLPDRSEVEADVQGIALADLHDRLDDIREGMAKQSGDKWKTCVFRLAADGKFKFDVAY